MAPVTRRCIVDALFRDSLEDYARHSQTVQEQMETGKPPFDGIQLALATHYHLDHWRCGSDSALPASESGCCLRRCTGGGRNDASRSTRAGACSRVWQQPGAQSGSFGRPGCGDSSDSRLDAEPGLPGSLGGSIGPSSRRLRTEYSKFRAAGERLSARRFVSAVGNRRTWWRSTLGPPTPPNRRRLSARHFRDCGFAPGRASLGSIDAPGVSIAAWWGTSPADPDSSMGWR